MAWDPTPWSIQAIGKKEAYSIFCYGTQNAFFLYRLHKLSSYSSKGGAQCRRLYKKGEDVRPYDMLGPGEEIEKNQKILLWLMEGQKEMVQHKRSPYG